MRRSPLWREFESGQGLLLRALRFLVLAGGIVLLGYAATLRLDWQQQLVLAVTSFVAALWINRSSRSRVATLTLVLLSIYSTVRYGVWRCTTAWSYFRDPGNRWTWLDVLFVCLLLAAELYAFAVLVLGYLQVAWPLRRSPVPLPDDPDAWPSVDLLIPTYDEPLHVVRYTALAAINIDWPAEKLNVYILDDGRREEFRRFAEEAGLGYITRPDNSFAKAGNINHAVKQLHSPYVAIFDCDHVPTRSFLQLTMGWLLRDPKLAVLQTPHHFYSPDPFERNLDQFRVIPNEDELYYGVIQDGNDFWNATCFCGSCAVLSRTALDEVGGLATETVTEDAHTSLRMQMRGWNTAYVNIPQAAGLATERLSAHIRQRIRWARGMVQILRSDNPLFARGLRVGQRLCYFNAMLHFLFALPRLIFLTAPLMYLLFGRTSVPGFWAAILAYAAPHLLLARLTHSRIQGAHRHSFWNEIYETVLAPYILFPTLVALISPRRGRFNVTKKGGVVESGFFDAQVARPFLLLLAFNAIGLFCGIARVVPFPTFAVPDWLSFLNWPAQLYSGSDLAIVCVNLAWVLFNIVILGVATAVAWESQQRRETVRVAMDVPSDVILPGGTMIQGITCDLSGGGVRTRVQGEVHVAVGDPVKFVFRLLDGTAMLPARVVAVEGDTLRARFENLTLQEDEALTTLLYSRADSWLNWGSAREPDHPLISFMRILRLSLHGLRMTLGFGRGGTRSEPAKFAVSVVPLLLVLTLAGVATRRVRAAQNETPPANASAPAKAQPKPEETTEQATPGQRKRPQDGTGAAEQETQPSAAAFVHEVALRDSSSQQAIVLRGAGSSRSVSFHVARNERVGYATLKLRYRAQSRLPAAVQVALNGIPIGTIEKGPSSGEEAGALLQWEAKVPPQTIAAENLLSFQLQAGFGVACNDPSSAGLWFEVDPASTLELSGTRVPVTDLGALPLPFFDPAVRTNAMVPTVLLAHPSPKALQASGIVASWFGALAPSAAVRFPVSVGAIPPGNVVVLADDSVLLPPELREAAASGPVVALRPNPSDPLSSVLLISGRNADELLTAASALASSGSTWQGTEVKVQGFQLPPERKPDDAPRWLSTERVSTVGEIAGGSPLQTDGSEPLQFAFRVPPDLDYGDRRNLALHLDYRYNGVPLGAGSTLQVAVNGSYVSSAPLPHTDSASPVLETVVPVPIAEMHPFLNTMLLDFRFRTDPAATCDSGTPPNLAGAIVKDSYLDLTGIPHTAAMPNLELFANAGYPFTRRADLADTAVVLPDQTTPAEMELFFSLMGRFGEATGYPALRVSVINPGAIQHDASKNYLLLGTASDQPVWSALADRMPAIWDSSGLRAREPDTAGPLSWLQFRKGHSDSYGELGGGTGAPNAVLEEFEWPKGSRRSAVAVMLRNDASAPALTSAFLGSAGSSQISQDVSVLRGSRFIAYRVRSSAYRVGDDSALLRISTTLKLFPWLIAALTVLFCFLIAVLMQAMLRRSARLRLRGVE